MTLNKGSRLYLLPFIFLLVYSFIVISCDNASAYKYDGRNEADFQSYPSGFQIVEEQGSKDSTLGEQNQTIPMHPLLGSDDTQILPEAQDKALQELLDGTFPHPLIGIPYEGQVSEPASVVPAVQGDIMIQPDAAMETSSGSANENDSLTRDIMVKTPDDGRDVDDLNPNQGKVPEWVKNTARWYGEGKLSDTEFLNALRYLINKGIIDLGSELGSTEVSE